MRKNFVILSLIAFVVPGCASTAPATTGASQPSAPTIAPSALALTPSQSSPKLPELVWRLDGNPGFFWKPGGLALDMRGNLYMWDGGDLRVQVFDPNGKPLFSWGGPGTGDGQFQTSGQHPLGSVAVDQQGNVYVPDYANARVQKFDSQGKFIAKWGQRGAADGEFTAPYAVAVDKQGRVYVVDDGTAIVQVFDGGGKFLSKFGGRGTGDGQFKNPSYITVDNQGNIYVPDYDTGRIQKFGPDGALLAKWNAECGDGAQVSPNEIAVDAEGNAYLTDYAKARICKFDSQGHFLFSFGTQVPGVLTDPAGIVVDDQGNVYVDGALPPFVQKYKQP